MHLEILICSIRQSVKDSGHFSGVGVRTGGKMVHAFSVWKFPLGILDYISRRLIQPKDPGYFLESPGNVSGPELYFEIKIYKTLP